MNKAELYQQAMRECEALLEDVNDRLTVMVTLPAVLKQHFDHYYWVGFYLVKNGRLEVGPYQGTVGCLYIDFGRGVCGKAAEQRQTLIVQDVHEFPDHIACDVRSQSEIVVPVFDQDGQLIAVLDVDSDQVAQFDETDQLWLERMVARFFAGGDA